MNTIYWLIKWKIRLSLRVLFEVRIKCAHQKNIEFIWMLFIAVIIVGISFLVVVIVRIVCFGIVVHESGI